MNFIDPIQYAPQWLKNAAKAQNENARAVALISIHDADPARYPSLRDRTIEVSAQLRGLVGDLSANVSAFDLKGGDLRQYGYDPVGAQFAQNFRLLVV